MAPQPSMRVLVVNAGSSSLKLRVLGADDDVTAVHDVDRWEAADENHELAAFLDSIPACDAVGHRVVHGGNEFRAAVRLDSEVEDALLGLTSLAPLHQPRAVAGIRMLARLRPELPQVACFDTAFHAAMPAGLNETQYLARIPTSTHLYFPADSLYLSPTDLFQAGSNGLQVLDVRIAARRTDR